MVAHFDKKMFVGNVAFSLFILGKTLLAPKSHVSVPGKFLKIYNVNKMSSKCFSENMNCSFSYYRE